MVSDAVKEKLGKLHEAVATELLDRVQGGEATPADLSVAVKFLKDNGVDAVVRENGPIFNLAMALPFQEPRECIEVKQQEPITIERN